MKVSLHGALRARLDTNGAAYQVDTPMIVEPFPRCMPSIELGLAVITDPVDRLLITMPGYTPGLGFQQFTFFFDAAHAAKGPSATLLAVYT